LVGEREGRRVGKVSFSILTGGGGWSSLKKKEKKENKWRRERGGRVSGKNILSVGEKRWQRNHSALFCERGRKLKTWLEKERSKGSQRVKKGTLEERDFTGEIFRKRPEGHVIESTEILRRRKRKVLWRNQGGPKRKIQLLKGKALLSQKKKWF